MAPEMEAAVDTQVPNEVLFRMSSVSSPPDSFGGAGEQYSVEELLGEGSYGSVYRCLRERDSAVFAVKIIDPHRIAFGSDSEERISEVEAMSAKEVQALRKLAGHPGIISLEAAFSSSATRQIFIVTEFVQGGHLFSHMVCRAEPFREPEAAHIVAQLSDALAFCHSTGVVNRDLKLENVLVSSVDVELVEERNNAFSNEITWRTQELFTVKICDFGVATAFKGHEARTPVGTPSYSAPEVVADAKNSYDAYKADAFSLGVMIFVMLCLGFPPEVVGEASNHQHKCWKNLSTNAKSLLDGLLERNPAKRLSVADVRTHHWVPAKKVQGPTCLDQDQVARYQHSKSKAKALKNFSFMSQGISQPTFRAQGPLLPVLLTLNRVIVTMQHERGMACWTLAGAPSEDGISSWDQLRRHIQLTDGRMSEVRELLRDHTKNQALPAMDDLETVISNLACARALTKRQCSSGAIDSEDGFTSFDEVFLSYNHACGALADIVARAVEAVRFGSSEGLHAAQRFRLLSVAAEQLCRERALALSAGMCNLVLKPVWQRSVTDGAGRVERDSMIGAQMPLELMRRLAEILGARKVLLGTVTRDGSSSGGDVAATSGGLLGALTGEAPVLSAADMITLESIEERVLAPSIRPAPAASEWWEVLTRMIKQIQSRIVMGLVEGMRVHQQNITSHGYARKCSREHVEFQGSRQHPQPARAQYDCGVRLGLRRILLNLADKLQVSSELPGVSKTT
ncbi:unnamed protein product [Polarella glacialis]|uniref:Protein kinase domain-containing protein n=1 Tax=Polarella glacialis TaxID=89957 RepID=A0A813KGB2_POLGL|nr:unnamed protein product [Polarella glacialis]